MSGPAWRSMLCILGLDSGIIGIMEKKMETTIVILAGLRV